MPNSNYYNTLTQPFRAADLRRNVVFSDAGFSYNSNGIGFVVRQTSKNHYVLNAIYCAKYEEYTFNSLRDVIDFALKLVTIDRAGKLYLLCKTD